MTCLFPCIEEHALALRSVSAPVHGSALRACAARHTARWTHGGQPAVAQAPRNLPGRPTPQHVVFPCSKMEPRKGLRPTMLGVPARCLALDRVPRATVWQDPALDIYVEETGAFQCNVASRGLVFGAGKLRKTRLRSIGPPLFPTRKRRRAFMF